MGAAVAKALGDIANAPEATAEARLAVAARAVLRWDCASDAGIWDAEAVCTNRSFLSAVDEILQLTETHAFPMVSPARRRMDSVLGVAMSRLMDEFLLLRVWDASQLQDTDGLRLAVERFSVSMAPGGGVWLAFPTGAAPAPGNLAWAPPTSSTRPAGAS
ncbi:hypothetical protein U9M48_016808 [Paspalum notatum var. saurae]|uniref:Uncharacterized protein n=1 Tax=Paspalum notatum var. saurae TaxID=547442 RepID=A0AAQ3WN76_PASNO